MSIRARMLSAAGMAGLLFATVLLFPPSGHGAEEEETHTMADATNTLPLLVHEEFSEGNADRWHPLDPKAWKVEERDGGWVYSVFQQSEYRGPVRSPWNISLLKEPVVSDFLLEVRLRSTTEDYKHRDMCIVFGYQDPSHFYYVHLGKNADPHSNSVFIVDGTDRVSIGFDRSGGTPWDDEVHTVRIRREVDSGSVEVFFDDFDTPVMRAKDSTFTWGLVGAGAFDDLGEIHELKLWGREVTDHRAKLP